MDYPFGEIRKICDHTARIQICFNETKMYEDYLRIDEVPQEYDSYTVKGIGLVRSEYKGEAKATGGRYDYAIEFRLE